MPEPDRRALEELERHLIELHPAAGGFDRDAVMYAAGRASAQGPGRWLWPLTSALLAFLLILVLTVVASYFAPTAPRPTLTVPPPPPQVAEPPPGDVPKPGPAPEPLPYDAP